MNDSSSSATRIIVGSDTERKLTRPGQWYNAGSRLRGTRTMPYAYWGCVWVRVRENQHRERTPSGVVSWTERVERESEWRNSRETEGRPKDAVERWKRDSDAQMNRQNTQESSQMMRTERSIRSLREGRMIILFNSSRLQRDCILWSHSSILSDESATIRVNVWLQTKSKKQRQIQSTNILGYLHRTFQSSGLIFLCLQFVFHCHLWAFLLSSRYKIRLPGDFFDQGQRLLEGSRVQSRFRGTRTMPYTVWAAGLVTPFVTPALTHIPIEVVIVRVREHPHEERTPSGLVSWTAAERDAAGIVSRSERKKEIEGGRRGTVQSRKRWTDKLSSSLSKCWELSAQSGQLARRESGFCSTRQFFKEIAILWRNWSILNDEARTTVQILSRDTVECKNNCR